MSEPDLSTWAAGRRVARYRLSHYLPYGSMWAIFHALPLITGLVLKAVFDRITQGGTALHGVFPLLALFIAAEAGRALVFWGAEMGWPGWWAWAASAIRANLLSAVIVAPGAPESRLPGSAGEAVGRARDDVEDVVWFVDNWVDGFGFVAFAVIAVAIMMTISALVTVVVVVPLAAVVAGTRILSGRLRRYHQSERASGASVTSFVADLFSSVVTIKGAGAEDDAVARFRTYNRSRADAAVRARLSKDLLVTVSGASVDISIGLVLLLAAPAMRDGSFTVGDLALFTTYATWLTDLPRWIGMLMARHRHATVSLARLARLDPDGRIDGVVAPRRIDLRRPHLPVPVTARPLAASDRLRSLAVRGLTVTHGTGGHGVQNVDLDVVPGSFTVVTGATGAGKTTLVRALLGLIPVESGELRWNGSGVTDPSTTMVPPRVSYVGQIPRLLSASMEDNLRLGLPAGPGEIADALRLSQLDGDVAALAVGLATTVGPRGSHLSGGQLQRVAIARAVLRRPELLVVDDASSALDIETETALWEALAGSGMTCLVVSHRRAALERAGQIVLLDEGRLTARGSLPDLLAVSTEFRRLWFGELLEEAEEAAPFETPGAVNR